MGSSAAGVAELVGPRVMAAEAWRSELNAVVAAVGKVGIAAAVAGTAAVVVDIAAAGAAGTAAAPPGTSPGGRPAPEGSAAA